LIFFGLEELFLALIVAVTPQQAEEKARSEEYERKAGSRLQKKNLKSENR